MGRPNAYARRTDYRARFYRDDYFVLKHLGDFINTSLRTYVARGARVADIGCGAQPLRAQIERLGATYTGVDIEQNPQQTVEVVASITDLPFAESSFDTILCTEVLEHVSDSYAAFGALLSWSFSTLAVGAKNVMNSVPRFFLIETAFTVVQWLIVAPLTALVLASVANGDAPMAGAKSNGNT